MGTEVGGLTMIGFFVGVFVDGLSDNFNCMGVGFWVGAVDGK